MVTNPILTPNSLFTGPFTIYDYLRLWCVDAHGHGAFQAAQWRRQRAASDRARGGLVAATGLTDGGGEETRTEEVAASRLS